MNGLPHESRPDDWQRLLGERAWLGALARQLVRRDEVADEAAHEALAAAWTSAVPGGVSARRWLAAILGKQLAGRRRAEHRRVAREQHVAAKEPSPPAADVVARFEVQRAVADAVVALPEPYRTTVLRRFWDDEVPAAIAVAMAVPVETVRTRLKRGLAMLRERLDSSHGGERRAWALPLWLATRRVDPLAMGLFLGVSLMTTLQKLVAAGIAAGFAVLLWNASPPPATPPEVAGATRAAAPVPAAGNLEPRATQPLASERAEAPAVGEPAAPGAAPDFVVTGTVVDDATDAPLAGLPVRLVTWPREEATEPATVSGVDGRFTLSAPRALAWGRQVLVLAPEYAFACAQVRVSPGETAPARGDAGTLRLVRGTWFSGQVVDAEGRAVAGASLLLSVANVSYGGYHPQQMLQEFAVLGRSDAEGRFRLTHAIGPDVDHANLLFAVAPTGIGWYRFTPTRQRSDVTNVVVRTRPSGALRVVVLDAAGAPCPGVLVRALPRFSPIGFESVTWRTEPSVHEPVRGFFRGTTDSSGVARFPVLPLREADLVRVIDVRDGAYDLWLEVAGFPTQPLLRCEVRPGAEVEVVAKLVEARLVTVAIAVRDDSGAPVEGVAVQVSGESTSVDVRTDASGRADVEIEAAPKLCVSAASDAHRPVRKYFDVGAGVQSIPVYLVLSRVRPLEGVVVDQHGEPVKGGSLSCDGHSIDAKTDEQGRFRIAKFPVGEHALTVALGPGMEFTHWTGKQEPEVVDAARGPVRIVLHRRLGRAEVRVAIVDARSGEPLEPTSARLGLLDSRSNHYAFVKHVSTGAGLVTSSATPAGKWRLDVVTASGHRGSLPFELDGTQAAVELHLPLQRPGTLTGRVQFVGVAVCEALTVHVQHAKPDPQSFVQYCFPGRWAADAASQRVSGDAMGDTGSLEMQQAQNPTFRLERVDPDQDLVLRAIGDGVAGELTVRVAPGTTSDVVLEVRPKG